MTGGDAPLQKIWIKASSLSGGQGIVPVENPTPASIKEAFNTIGEAPRRLCRVSTAKTRPR